MQTNLDYTYTFINGKFKMVQKQIYKLVLIKLRCILKS